MRGGTIYAHFLAQQNPRWLLYSLPALNMPGATHTSMEAVLNSLSVTVTGTPNQALFGCLFVHRVSKGKGSLYLLCRQEMANQKLVN